MLAPRRYGKTSLVLRAMQERARRRGARRVLRPDADADESTALPQVSRRRSSTISLSPIPPPARAGRAPSSAASACGRRSSSTPVTAASGSRSRPSAARADIDATIERLLELPAEIAAERNRRVVLVFDEFQEVIQLDPRSPIDAPRLPDPAARSGTSTWAAGATCSSRSSTTATSPSGGARSRSSSAGSGEGELEDIRAGAGSRRATAAIDDERARPAARANGRPSVRHAGAGVLHLGGRCRSAMRRAQEDVEGRAHSRPPLRAQQPRARLGGRHPRTSGRSCSPSTRSPAAASMRRRTADATACPRRALRSSVRSRRLTRDDILEQVGGRLVGRSPSRSSHEWLDRGSQAARDVTEQGAD